MMTSFRCRCIPDLKPDHSVGAIRVPERLPTTYSQIADWVDQTYSDRLVLIGRARRVLKDAVYKDVELVTSCLQLLATEYWLMRTAEPREHDAAKLASSLVFDPPRRWRSSTCLDLCPIM
jgi:hypothetical protein